MRSPRIDPLRSFAANLLHRVDSSSKILDEVLASEFARLETVTGNKRHRARLLVQEVVKRKGTIDQILKIYASRSVDEMENHVRTILRMALAEWFFVPPAPLTPDEKATLDEELAVRRKRLLARAEREPAAVGGPDLEDDEENGESRGRGRGRGRDRGRGRGRFDRSRDRDRGRGRPPRHVSEEERALIEGRTPPPIARGPIAAALVNLVGEGRPSRGFVNGILRRIDRAARFEPGLELGGDDFPRDLFPAAGGGAYRFDQPLFADPEHKPATWLAQYQSLSRWLTERFIARYELKTAVEVALASNAAPALSVRINTRRTTPEAALKELEALGVEIVSTPFPEVFRLATHIPLTKTDLFQRGEIYLQDLTSTRIGHAVDLRPGMRVLDACAAPGGKLTHICERLDGKGTFVALDISDRRLVLVEDNIERLGHHEIQVERADLREYAAGPERPEEEKFDLVLVDAPCTNTGVLARRVDARWRVNDKLQHDLIQLQTQLLESARRLVKTNGRIIYSTCTLEPEENRGIVERVGLDVVHDELWLPQPSVHDGGYHAVLRDPSTG